ncbi:hypothetical protein GWK47_007974 [Chionoecetes opilio]|uniref:Uncharacterized protein n=1 Tax=Chionoecetes opilio TaxID=41210 RepID=A0A8J4Y7E5_CHIOP|nr:hypothetical protein GWK47_007974 [Chionoecetes opilio]
MDLKHPLAEYQSSNSLGELTPLEKHTRGSVTGNHGSPSGVPFKHQIPPADRDNLSVGNIKSLLGQKSYQNGGKGGIQILRQWCVLLCGRKPYRRGITCPPPKHEGGEDTLGTLQKKGVSKIWSELIMPGFGGGMGKNCAGGPAWGTCPKGKEKFVKRSKGLSGTLGKEEG